jgi:thiol-disulfide isomerase/thioredoxin
MEKIMGKLCIIGIALFLMVAAWSACGEDSINNEVVESDSTQSDLEVGDQGVSAQADITSSTPVVESDPTPVKQNEIPPELLGVGGWINADPFTLESKRGSVVLVDFWTYTCVNCIRTFPYLKAWHENYSDAGLVIVGVHTPEFEFEKIYDNVAEAVANFGIKYPVVQDNQYATWDAFENKAWPAKYLIDKDGEVRYVHFGEGNYSVTEQRIRELLSETGADIANIDISSYEEPIVAKDARTGDMNVSQTRELYLGYKRNYILAMSEQSQPPYIRHNEYYGQGAMDSDVDYTDPGEHHNQFVYLHGLWRNEPEKVVHARNTENNEDYILLMFYATSVNAVMSSRTTDSFIVTLTLDGSPMNPEQAGADVSFDDDGNSYVTVNEPRMYRLVNQDKFTSHELKLSSNSDKFSVFAFTFGAYVGGEPN